MDPNILLFEPPQTVDLCGGSVRIRTEYKIWIAVQKICDDPTIPKKELGGRILLGVYDNTPTREEARSPLSRALANPSEALEAALYFFNFNEPKRPQTAKQSRASRIRSFDWDWDAYMVIADFQREYGIDLTDPTTTMHWWRFWSLFKALGNTSRTMQAIATRTADEDGLSKEEKAALRERKQAMMLPARTQEEARRNRDLRWGQDV